VGSLACRPNFCGESCDGISSERPVGVVNGDAQIRARHCATNTAGRRNKDDSCYYGFSIAHVLLEACWKHCVNDA
jgi:hypothetical protein